MKRMLTIVILAAVLAVLAACNTPAPLPVAPTGIPTLPPATLPPPGAEVAAGAPGQAAAVSVAFPLEPPSAAAGRAVYETWCASCHGADGQGLVEGARDFSDVDYVRAASPLDFYQAVTGGRGKMPGFEKEIAEADRWNAVFFLWSFSVKPELLAQGKAVFEANCAACHGADGKGLIPQAPKLATPEFVAKYPATQFYQSVSAGKGIMPAWQDRLSADERWAAVEYGRSLAYKPLGQ